MRALIWLSNPDLIAFPPFPIMVVSGGSAAISGPECKYFTDDPPNPFHWRYPAILLNGISLHRQFR